MSLKQIEVERRLKQTFAVNEEEYSRRRDSARTADIRRIKISRASVRKHFDGDEIQARAASIEASGGKILKPLYVRYVPGDSSFEKFELFAGEINFRAAQLLGLKEVPVEIFDISEGEARMLSLTDNTSQVPLTIQEEIAAVAELSANGFSIADIDRHAGIGKGRDGGATQGWAQNRLDASKASPAILSILDERKDGLSHVLLIHRDTHVFKHPQLEARLIRYAKQGYSVRELKAVIAEHKAQRKREKDLAKSQFVVKRTDDNKPMPTTQGTTPALSYATTRTAPEINTPPETQNALAAPSPERVAATNAIADSLRAIEADAPHVEAAPDIPDETLAVIDNLQGTLENVRNAYASAADAAQKAQWRTTLIQLLESALHQARAIDEKLRAT